MKRILEIAVVACLTLFPTFTRGQTIVLQPITTFGPNTNGSIQPGQVDVATGVTDFTDSGYYSERGMAYNPMTGHLIFVTRTNYIDNYYSHAYILDGATGTNLTSDGFTPEELDLTDSQVTGGNPSFPFDMIGIADDGAIYIADLSNGQVPPQYRLYRWDSEEDGGVGNLVYYGDPGNGNPLPVNERWGDTMAVRGSGINTQILIASRGTLAAIFTPTDASMSSFTATTLNTDIPITVGMGYGLCFGAGNTFYSKSASSTGLPLVLLSFDLNAGTATTLRTFSLSEFPGRTGVLGYLPASNYLACIENSPEPNLVRLYDVSNPTNAPVFLDRQPFITTNANNNFCGALTFGTNGALYALSSENGIMAYSMLSSNDLLTPAIYLQPANQTVYVPTTTTFTNLTLTVAADGSAPITYQWLAGSTPISNATNASFMTNIEGTFNGASFRVVVSNAYGVITSAVATLDLTTQLPVSLPWYEPFNYAAGTLSTNGGWYVQSGSTGKVAAGNLTVPGLPAPAGNEFQWPSTTMSDRLPFGINNSGTIYYSIALDLTTLSGLTAFPGVLFGFANGTGTAFVKLDVITNGAGGYYVGPSIQGALPSYASSVPLGVGQTVFIVQSYTFTGTGTDTSYVWINPSPSTFGATAPPLDQAAVSSTGPAMALIDRFFFRFSSGNQPSSGAFADELRIGTSWASVTPIGPPALQIQPSGPNIDLMWSTNVPSFTLRKTMSLNPPITWTTVTNAVSINGNNYQVTVPAGTADQYFQLAHVSDN